jgi:hypothetical protein
MLKVGLSFVRRMFLVVHVLLLWVHQGLRFTAHPHVIARNEA